MEQFIGKNVQNITLKKQSDVVIRKVLSTSATVTVEENTTLEPGQVLITADGGKTFSIALEDSEANAILCEACDQTGEAEVLLSGVVRQKYLAGFVDAHGEHLFKNKIILR